MSACWACTTPVGDELDPTGYLCCRACGLRFSPSGEAPRERYAGDYFHEYRGGDYYATEPLRRHEARERLALAARYTTGRGSLLDVGSAAGFFVDEATRAGWTAEGIEPSPQAAAFSRSLGVSVSEGFVEDLDLAADAFDAVTLWHTLEHIPDPAGTLTALRGALRAGGHILIEVPNGASTLAQRQGAQWFALEPDVHVAQWTPDALRAVLERTGFVVKSVATVPFLTYVPTARGRLPRRVYLALRQRRWLRDPHPSGHELLRAVATKPPERQSGRAD